MNNLQSVQALEGGMLTELGIGLRKSVVTVATLVTVALIGAPQTTLAVGVAAADGAAAGQRRLR